MFTNFNMELRSHDGVCLRGETGAEMPDDGPLVEVIDGRRPRSLEETY